jgi:hypothetical protein
VVPRDSRMLSVPVVTQPRRSSPAPFTSSWCWSACTVAIARFYGRLLNGATPTVENNVIRVLGAPVMNHWAWGRNIILSQGDLNSIYNIPSTHLGSPLTRDQILIELTNGRPVWARVLWNTGGTDHTAHHVLVTGHRTETGVVQFRVMDPLTDNNNRWFSIGDLTNNYPDPTNSSSVTATWTYSLRNVRYP